MDFVRRAQCTAVQRAVQAWHASDAEKDEMCRVWEVVVEADADEAGAREAAPMSELEMLVRAELELGVPYWFVRWWYCDMAKNGWMTSGGIEISPRNWASLLKRWWSHTREDVLSRMQGQYSVAVQGQLGVTKSAAAQSEKNAAQKSAASTPIKAKVPRRPIVTAHHWYECQRTCKNFRDGFCACGYRLPAVLHAPTFGVTERCAKFAPLPSEWQNAWALDFPASVTKDKLQLVKDYFAAHPDELAEAKWRNEANEPTEDECADVQRYLDEVLAWHKLSKAEQEEALKAAKEAGKAPQGRD